MKTEHGENSIEHQAQVRNEEQVLKRREKVKAKIKIADITAKSTNSLQDRLFSIIMQQVLPSGDVSEDNAKSERRPRSEFERPNFSLPAMSNNFRRFNARIGAVFTFQNRLIRLFLWRVPTQTLSFLAMYTFCCLERRLLLILPLLTCLFFIMIPAFLARHPPPLKIQLTDTYGASDPKFAPIQNVKLGPESSKDFFRNMRDLQNSMDDFSVIHDQLLGIITPLTNFSDERLSSTVFFVLSMIAGFLFVFSDWIPYRAVFLVVGWATICSSHPAAKIILASIDGKLLKNQAERARRKFEAWMFDDIVLDEAPEVREVEIFELQRLQKGTQWTTWVYSSSPYDPLSPLRVSGNRPRGSRFFEDIQHPPGWEWSDKTWTLDLFSRDWVEERMITAVEVEMEGERWVYDIGVSDAGQHNNTSNVVSSDGREKMRKPDREESTGLGVTGEWRRRRWIRLVERKAPKATS